MELPAKVTEQALVLTPPAGELDAAARHALAERTTTLPPPELVVFDLRKITGLSAAGAGDLLALAAAQAERGVRCAVLADQHSPVNRALLAVDPRGVLPRFSGLEELLIGPAGAEGGIDELVPQFETLTRTLLTATTVAEALQQIITAARHLVQAAEVVSVTLRAPDGTFTTPVETDAVATELDGVQYRTGRGPCIDAADPGGPGYVVSADLVTDERWPEFAAVAVGNGLTGVLATELLSPSNKAVAGALNIFTKHHDGLAEADRHTALLLATHASLALAHLQATELASVHAAQMRRAVDSRDIIGQAKGILMNRQGITADEAFALLRQTSQHLNVKLVEVATTFVARHSEFGPPTGT